MVAIETIILFITATTALSINQRDTPIIVNDIINIDTDVKSLITAVNNYNGGGFPATVPIVSAQAAIDGDLNLSTEDIQATSQLSSADSNSVINALNNLIPDIEAALTTLKEKKSIFENDGFVSVVESDLKILKSDTDAFIGALVAIVSPDTKNTANSLKTRTSDDFDSAIQTFSSSAAGP